MQAWRRVHSVGWVRAEERQGHQPQPALRDRGRPPLAAVCHKVPRLQGLRIDPRYTTHLSSSIHAPTQPPHPPAHPSIHSGLQQDQRLPGKKGAVPCRLVRARVKDEVPGPSVDVIGLDLWARPEEETRG